MSKHFIDGVKYLYDPTTKLRYEGEVKALDSKTFQPHGIGKLLGKEGQVIYEGIFKDGYIKEGRYYHEKGHLIYEGEFERGEFGGQGRLYDVNGELDYEGTFKDGLPNGLGRSYINGQVEYEGVFKDGLPHGLGRKFIEVENGFIIEEGQFENDILISPQKVDPAYLPPLPFVVIHKYDDQAPVYKFPALGEPCTEIAAFLTYDNHIIAKYIVPLDVDKKLANFFIDYHVENIISDREINGDGRCILTKWDNTPDIQVDVISNRISIKENYFISLVSELYPDVPQDILLKLKKEEAYSLLMINKSIGRVLSSAELMDMKNQVSKLLADEKRLAKIPEVLDRYENAKKTFESLNKPSKTFLREVNRDAANAFEKSKAQLESVSKELSNLKVIDRSDFLGQASAHIKAKKLIPLYQIGLDRLHTLLTNAVNGISNINDELHKTLTPKKSLQKERTITLER